MIFRKNPGFESELKQESSYVAGLAEAAKPAARQVQAVSHRIMPRGRGQQITVEVDAGQVSIVNNDHGAHIDEYGSINSPAYAPLRRGVRAAGLRLREQ